MESPLNRYRSFTVLVLVIFAQLILLAVQVKNDQNVSVIRSWTVTAVSPNAGSLGGGTTVTLTGTNFTTGATVSFGGTLAGAGPGNLAQRSVPRRAIRGLVPGRRQTRAALPDFVCDQDV